MLASQPGKKLDRYIADYVVFDLETTGCSAKSDAVVEISAVKVINGQIVDEFSTLVNPERPIPEQASYVNGITDDMVIDAPIFQVALRDFLDFAGDMVLVGHNIHAFDMKFICRDAMNFWEQTIGNDYIDTYQLSKVILPDLTCHQLGFLAEYFGFSSSGAHRALADCKMNQHVYEALGQELSKIPRCPKCENLLKKREGKFGPFLGCSAFPNCRYTRDL